MKGHGICCQEISKQPCGRQLPVVMTADDNYRNLVLAVLIPHQTQSLRNKAFEFLKQVFTGRTSYLSPNKQLYSMEGKPIPQVCINIMNKRQT